MAQSTKATSVLTSSSGCTITIPAEPNFTAAIQALIFYNGPSLVTINDSVTITGLAQINPLTIPLSEILSGPIYVHENFSQDQASSQGQLLASAVNTAIVITVPALLGGGQTDLIVFYRYN